MAVCDAYHSKWEYEDEVSDWDSPFWMKNNASDGSDGAYAMLTTSHYGARKILASVSTCGALTRLTPRQRYRSRPSAKRK